MRLIQTLAAKKDTSIETQMEIIRGSLYFFISACENEGTDPDNMFSVLLIALEYYWGECVSEYFHNLREAFEKVKNDKVSIV